MAIVTVRYFAAASEAAGREEEQILLDGSPSLGGLRDELERRYGEPMARVLRSGSFLIDGRVSRDPDRPLGAAVDILPPFAGG
ncbi:molybdopterin converting factor small subunit [Microbacterium resistens]|uniref:Molybdopterin converting factor small subunit n=1 Tax=Microbacterium resistens TaxID=156977 RepID=A0ABU1SDQ1_9MICO|nr:MoaD/ThiS family protein [Microbacterium resistens]MDR6867734.1 molybdopterin converting factor small subunit [Microbacterium resistens]